MAAPETRTAGTDQALAELILRERRGTPEQIKSLLAQVEARRREGRPDYNLGRAAVDTGLLTTVEAAQFLSRVLDRQRAIEGAAPELPKIPGYELLALLGRGGMGSVYKARQVSMDRMVAMKVLAPNVAEDPQFVERLLREARAVARLNHPNIVLGIDAGEADGVSYFVMEYVDGESLHRLLQREKKLPERKCLDIGLQTAQALRHAEQHGIVHRDVKPENLLITREGVVKLCDLGLAKRVKTDPNLTAHGIAVGTPHYIAPEQARGQENLDIRADIYSLGATLYRTATGTTPYTGKDAVSIMTQHITEPLAPPRKRNPELSPGFEELVVKMMAKRREDRHANATELVGHIDRVIKSPQTRAAASPALKAKPMTQRAPEAVKARAVAMQRRRILRWAAIGGAAALLLAGAGIALLVALGDKPEPAPTPPVAGAPEPEPPAPAPTPTPVEPTPLERFHTRAESCLASDRLAGLREAYGFGAAEAARAPSPEWDQALGEFRRSVEERLQPEADRRIERAREQAGQEEYFRALGTIEEFPDEWREYAPNLSTAAFERARAEAVRLGQERDRKVEAARTEALRLAREGSMAQAFAAIEPLPRWLGPTTNVDQAREALVGTYLTSLSIDDIPTADLERTRRTLAEVRTLAGASRGIVARVDEVILRIDQRLSGLRRESLDRASTYVREMLAPRVEADLGRRAHAEARGRLAELLFDPGFALEQRSLFPAGLNLDALRAYLVEGSDPGAALAPCERAVLAHGESELAVPFHLARTVLLLDELMAQAERGLEATPDFRFPKTRPGRVTSRLIEETQEGKVLRVNEDTPFGWSPAGERPVHAEDIAALAEQSSPPDARGRCARGFLFYYAGPEEHPAAKAELQQAIQLDPAQEVFVRRYLNRLEGMGTAEEEAEAAQLLETARRSARSRSTSARERAQEALEALTTRLSHTRTSRENRPEIDSLLAALRAAAQPTPETPPEPDRSNPFAVEPRRDGEIWSLTYDFTDPNQLRDWVGLQREVENGVVHLRGRGGFMFKGKMEGAVTIEVDFMPTEQPRNIGFALHVTGEGDGATGYLALLDLDLGGGRLEGRAGPRGAIFRLPIPEGLRASERLVASTQAQTGLQANRGARIAFSWTQGRLDLGVNGRRYLQEINNEFGEGIAGVVLMGTPLDVDEIRVRGRIDPEWLEQATQE